MLSTRAGITGIIMVLCLIVAYSFAFNRREQFNRFWYTHQLLLVMLICMCIHGTGNLLEPFQSLYWVIGPLALYTMPRLLRETSLSSLEVEKVERKKGNVIQLRLKSLDIIGTMSALACTASSTCRKFRVPSGTLLHSHRPLRKTLSSFTSLAWEDGRNKSMICLKATRPTQASPLGPTVLR